MASKMKIVVAREKVSDNEIHSVQKIPADQVCVVYLGGNGTIAGRRPNDKFYSLKENASGNARYVRMDIVEPLMKESGTDIPIYSVGYDFDEEDHGGQYSMLATAKRATLKAASKQSEKNYDNYWVIDNKNIKGLVKKNLLPYLSENGQKIATDEVLYRMRFLKFIIDGDEKTKFNFIKELNDALLDLKYKDFEIDYLMKNLDNKFKKMHNEHIDYLYRAIILPRISNRGVRPPLDDVLRSIRKITFVAHCYGALIAQKLQEKMKSDMPKLGYSDKEIKMILDQMLIVAHAPSCRLNKQSKGFISFVSAFDDGVTVPVNWLTTHIRGNVSRDTKEMMKRKSKSMEHTWFPHASDKDPRVAFLPQRYGNVVLVPRAFDMDADEDSFGVDSNEHNNTSYDTPLPGETLEGVILNNIAKSVIKNGIKNSLNQNDGYVPLPDTAELMLGDKSETKAKVFEHMRENGMQLVRDAVKTATKRVGPDNSGTTRKMTIVSPKR